MHQGRPLCILQVPIPLQHLKEDQIRHLVYQEVEGLDQGQAWQASMQTRRHQLSYQETPLQENSSPLQCPSSQKTAASSIKSTTTSSLSPVAPSRQLHPPPLQPLLGYPSLYPGVVRRPSVAAVFLEAQVKARY
jgi:hypothetical protein